MIDAAVQAVRAGQPVVLPFDTVYGLAADPEDEDAVEQLYRLKGRGGSRPTALVAVSIEHLVERIPELREPAGSKMLALLPGPVTLIVPNPARRFSWLTGANPDAIGVRVPDLIGTGGEVLRRVGVVAATSANHPGEPDPRRLEDVPEDIRSGAGAALDGGELPGTPSTVIDLTGTEPRVLREGALAAADALGRLASGVRST